MPLKFKPKLSRYFRFKICFFPEFCEAGKKLISNKKNSHRIKSVY